MGTTTTLVNINIATEVISGRSTNDGAWIKFLTLILIFFCIRLDSTLSPFVVGGRSSVILVERAEALFVCGTFLDFLLSPAINLGEW